MADPEPELIADYQCQTGEGPLWHPDQRRVYWVDIPAGRMFWYDPATGRHEQCYQGDSIGGFTVQDDGALLLFQSRGAVRSWRDGTLDTVVEEIPYDRDSRFNDVIADPLGGVFCGTMATGDHPGKLYRLAPDGSLAVVLDEVRTPNGMGFTPDRRQMYFTDSPKHEIYRFEFDPQTGAVSNRRVFVHTEDNQGVPDGMTVDADGYVWSARWDGGCLVRYAPDGTEDRRVSFPARKVSCVTFGGDDYADMYVTCAGGPNKAAEGAGAGALFRVRLGIKGVPEFRSRVHIGGR